MTGNITKSSGYNLVIEIIIVDLKLYIDCVNLNQFDIREESFTCTEYRQKLIKSDESRI